MLKGYKDIMENCMNTAKALREGIEKTGRFEIVSKDVGVPLVAFALKDSSKHDVFEISENLRRFGWIVPAYTMPADAEHIAVLRVVVREDFSWSLGERLLSDIEKVMKELDHMPSKSNKAVNVTAMTQNVKDAAPGDGVVLKKSVSEIHQEITSYWKRLLDDRKKTSGIC
ncbi:hypothetical protein ACLOJK_025507 [Asimina triloba]